MSREIVLNIGGTPDELERINAAVEALAEQEDWPAELTFQIILVLEELEMNIIRHAYHDDGSARSRIVLNSEPSRLTIEVIDHGPPFNPLTDAKTPDVDAPLEDRKVGGLGVYLVRSMMDDISYRREDDKNCLTLVKRRDS